MKIAIFVINCNKGMVKGKTKLSEDKVKYDSMILSSKTLQLISKRVQNVNVNSNPCQGTPTTDRHSSDDYLLMGSVMTKTIL